MGGISPAEGLMPVGGARPVNDEPFAWGLAGWSGREKAFDIRPYQDLECIIPHDQSPSVGGAYAKLRGSHPAGWEFTGDDGVN
jgi:hypothetical protein